MTPTDLGPLAFTAEDFSKGEDAEVGEWISLEWLAEAANRILAEKLAKAPEVFTDVTMRVSMEIPNIWAEGRLACCTHSARLVCIEEIKK